MHDCTDFVEFTVVTHVRTNIRQPKSSDSGVLLRGTDIWLIYKTKIGESPYRVWHKCGTFCSTPHLDAHVVQGPTPAETKMVFCVTDIGFLFSILHRF